MAASPPATALSARETIQFTIRILRSYGIENLTPEIIRQAKFNALAAGAPLLKALHDLALCVAAGLPRGCGAGMAALRQQLAHELVDADATTPEGRLLLLHWLSSWGCPAGLVAQLAAASPPTVGGSDKGTSSSSSSRLCLLALAWLIGHARLFERALHHLQLPQQLLPLLPPYPEDTRQTAAAQARCSAAVAAAQQHAQRVQHQLQSLAAAAPNGDRGSCWPAVQAAAHHVLASYRAATLRLQLLTSLQEGREKLLHQIQQQQQQQQQDASSRAGSGSQASSSQPATKAAAAAGAGGRARAKHPPLTAFELHLLSRPQLLQQHEGAVMQASSLLQQQLQCVQAAVTFFAWAGSVLQEEQNAATAAAGCYSSGGGQLAGQRLPDLAEVVPLVQQLPAADSLQAASVLQRVAKQLQQAAAAAGFDAGVVNGLASSSRDASTAAAVVQLAGLSLQAAGSKAATAADAAALQPFFRLAAAAMDEAGIGPSGEQQLQRLPDDIQQQLAAVVVQQQPQQHHQQPGCAWHRLVLTPEQMSALHDRWHHQQKQHGQQQQQQQQQQPEDAATTDALSLAEALLKPVSGQRPGELVPVAAELHRLQAQAMQVAKALAKTRATNRQQLQAAEEALAAAAGARGEQLVFLRS